MLIYAVIGLAIICIFTAFLLGKKLSQRRFQAEREAMMLSHQSECEQYKQEIEKLKQTQHQQQGDQAEYQSHVSQHFAKSAELMAEMAKQYQSVYQHMSDTAHQLLPEAEANALLLKVQQADNDPDPQEHNANVSSASAPKAETIISTGETGTIQAEQAVTKTSHAKVKDTDPQS